MSAPPLLVRARRNSVEARRNAAQAYPFKCCVVCGLQLAAALDVAHLDHDVGNNAAENLAYLCKTHHWMLDAGMYPVAAIRLLRSHWQQNHDKTDHSARMKDAGAAAALTRKRRAAARKAVATRRRNDHARVT